jgi:hypothetical protein
MAYEQILRKSLNINDLRGPGRRNPLVTNDLQYYSAMLAMSQTNAQGERITRPIFKTITIMSIFIILIFLFL